MNYDAASQRVLDDALARGDSSVTLPFANGKYRVGRCVGVVVVVVVRLFVFPISTSNGLLTCLSIREISVGHSVG